MTTDQRPIVVIVPTGDADDTASALRYASWEALVHGCALHLVAPCRPAERACAERRVAEAVADAELMAGPGVPVDGGAAPGPTAWSVLSAAGRARLVVVRQQDALRLLDDLDDAAPTLGVIPADWTVTPDDRRPVLLGVADPAGARSLLARGLEIARVHETALRVLYAWHAHGSYEDELLDEARECRSVVLERTGAGPTAARVLPVCPCPVVLLP